MNESNGGKPDQELLSLFHDILSVDTQNPPGNEMALAEYIGNYLKKGRIFIQEIETERANLAAVIRGTGEKRPLILCGHMDTVPAGSTQAWQHEPIGLTVRDGKGYGRGTSDMKSGLACMLYCFKKCLESNKKPKGDIWLFATADEEAKGKGAAGLRESLLDKDAELLLIGEPTDNQICLCAKGTVWLEYTLTGKSAHASYPEQGINAIAAAFYFSDLLNRELPQDRNPYLGKTTAQLTLIRGGTKINMIPEKCEFSMDIRSVPEFQSEEIMKCVERTEARLKSLYPGLKLEKTIVQDRKAISIDSANPSVKELTRICREVGGKEPRYCGVSYFSDASVLCAKADIPTILLGPGSPSLAHTANEFVNLEQLFEAVKIYDAYLQLWY